MGVDFEDYDNDGWPDAIITDLANQRYALYKNNGDGTFDYASNVTGISAITLLHSGWGVRFPVKLRPHGPAISHPPVNACAAISALCSSCGVWHS